MSRYLAIWQDTAADRRFELDSLSDRAGKLRIEISDETDQKFVITSESYLYYRRLDEGDALIAIGEIRDSAGLARVFYRVEKSGFLEWFDLQNHGIYKDRGLQHFAICTTNDIVDLITFDMPKIALVA